jgi:type VI protein secretion system component VasF
MTTFEAKNPVRVVEVLVDGLDLGELGFEGRYRLCKQADSGRSGVHASAADDAAA